MNALWWCLATTAASALPLGNCPSPCKEPCNRPCTEEAGGGCARPTVGDRVFELELLALDLDTCTRCTETEASIETTIRRLRPIFEETGAEIRFRRTLVATAEEAVRHRLRSSPTIRINGRDVPVEFRESRCGDCGELCKRGAAIDCRVWVWQGQEHTSVPKGLVVDALLRAYAHATGPAPVHEEGFVLPENLRRFFASRRDIPRSTARATPCCDEKVCCKPRKGVNP